MNLDEFLRSAQAPTSALQAQGQLFVIRCVPDPFTGEVLNIGVCGVGANGERLVKVITEAGRLKCLYGDSAAAIVNMAATAKYCLEQGLPSPSPQLRFDEPLPFFNSTLESAVADAYLDQVTVALPYRQNKVAQIDDDAVATSVRRLLEDRLQLDAGELMPAEPMVMVPTDESEPVALPRMIRVPIRARYGYGALRSADFAGGTVRQHLMDSLLDLSFAGRYRQRQLQAMEGPALAIFVMHNPESSRARRQESERVVEDIATRAAGLLEVVPALGAADMAHAVIDWSRQHDTLPPGRQLTH